MKSPDKQYTCLIIDDDFSSIGILKHYISLIPKLRLHGSFLNPVLGVEEIVKLNNLDFLFLDINMPISGLDIALLIREQVKYIIIVTGHSENALKAFGAKVDDFVLKPLSFEKFLTTLNKSFSREIFDIQR